MKHVQSSHVAILSMRALRAALLLCAATISVVDCSSGSSTGGNTPLHAGSAGGATGAPDAGAAGATVDAGAGGAANLGAGGGGFREGGAVAAGGGGGASTCSVDADCTGKVPATTPASCAEGYCDPATKACRFRAKDIDNDGHRGAQCVAIDATPIETGDDCNDQDPSTFPGAWDGPADGAKPDSCDGIDEDCDGKDDDSVTSDGKSCFCTNGDVVKCSEDGGGHPITFPKLDGSGNPLGACALGKKTCGANGKYGACVGAIGPDTVDRCDGQDENCDGLTDMADTIPPINQITFTFDGDDDGFASSTDPQDAKTTSCPGATPTTCPSYLDTTKFPCNPSIQWKTVALPLKDCNDNDASVFPGAQEFCNTVDDDCNGTVDDSYAVDAANWVFDYDGDNAGDVNTPTVHSCQAPTTLPDGCATMASNLPAKYCTGAPGEGAAPTCPPAACTLAMWKRSIPQTDCKDRPDEDNPVGGFKANLVHVGGTDLCNGLDYDCDGTPDTGCGCSPVGNTKTCGDATTCNAGTETCNQGGIWGTCSGGDPKVRADYCPDQDSDGYCDLTKCQTSLCPAAVPKGFKQKSLCFAQTDCNDNPATKGASIHPGGTETCNGDGTDYNCNTIPNTPGAGDCSCVAGTKNLVCAPTGYVYPAGKKPGDALSGICQWGAQSCNPDGTLTPCTGGVSGFSSEQCASPSATDYDCNGVPSSTQCNCANGAITPCENVSDCNKGCIQTCVGGQWGAPSVPPRPQLTDCYPDTDHDGTCAASAPLAKCPPGTWGNDANAECSTDCVSNDATRNFREGKNCVGAGVAADCNDNDATVEPHFSQDPATACGAGGGAWSFVADPAVEKCGDGIDSDCDGNDSNGYNLGAACSAGGANTSCYQTGSTICSFAGSTGTTCSATAASASATPLTSPRNGSFDNNCDGVFERPNVVTGFNVQAYDNTVLGSTACSNGQADCNIAACSGLGFYAVAALCDSTVSVSTANPEPSTPYSFSFNFGSPPQRTLLVPACGTGIMITACHNCAFDSVGTVTQTCY